MITVYHIWFKKYLHFYFYYYLFWFDNFQRLTKINKLTANNVDLVVTFNLNKSVFYNRT